jgi:hypothetical protein
MSNSRRSSLRVGQLAFTRQPYGQRKVIMLRCMRCGETRNVETHGRMDWCASCSRFMMQTYGIKILSEN